MPNLSNTDALGLQVGQHPRASVAFLTTQKPRVLQSGPLTLWYHSEVKRKAFGHHGQEMSNQMQKSRHEYKNQNTNGWQVNHDMTAVWLL